MVDEQGARTGKAVELRGADGHVFRFVPGALCLELAVTGGEDERAIFETLHEPEDLRAWLRVALGLPVSAATTADLAAAKRLREAVWHCALAAASQNPLPPRWVAVINEAASDPTPIPRIGRDGRRTWRTPVSAGQALSAVARDAVELLTGPTTDRIRQCAGANCTLLFVDTSRPGKRRWCSMQRCGNRAKTRSFRARRTEENPR